MWKKINEIEMILHDTNLDCLGVAEANLKTNAVMEKASIPGYKMISNKGREHRIKQNSRVVAFVKDELSYELVEKYMGNDLMPEIWIKLGHRGTKRTMIGFVYREHKPWKLGDATARSHENRLKAWLETRRPIWQGTEETYMLGDINLDWAKRGEAKYRNSKMLKKLEIELSELGWVQLVQKNTHYNNANGVISESLINHIWTNTPVRVLKCGQEVNRASDHQLEWFERSSKNLVEKVKQTEKRSMKKFTLEVLEELCRQEDWVFQGEEERSEKLLEERVLALETKIQKILEKVAPMEVKKLAYRGKPRWITKELESLMKERKRTDRKASQSR